MLICLQSIKISQIPSKAGRQNEHPPGIPPESDPATARRRAVRHGYLHDKAKRSEDIFDFDLI
jgi:hypothetical protein